MVSVVRPLAVRALTLFGVLIAVLVLLVISLGATGFSDRLLEAQVNEELRAFRQGLAQTVRDPAEVERAATEQQAELERFYGLDEPWWQRLPPEVFRVLRLGLGDGGSLRAAEGGTKVSDSVLERLPYT